MEEKSASDSLPLEDTESPTIEITLQSLLGAGAHYGHQTDDWCPKMAPYLYGTKSVHNVRRSGVKHVYIFNLELTVKLWQRARRVIVDTVASGGSILFVGPKKQCKEIIEKEAKRCKSYYVSNKWIGGTLSNFDTVKESLQKLDNLEKLLSKANDPNSTVKLPKRERLEIQRKIDRLESRFGGIRGMKKLPDMVFVVDTDRSRLAIAESKLLDIPVVGIVDSNSDPDWVDYALPSNDDAAQALTLFVTNVSDAVLEGQQIRKERVEQEAKEKVEQAQELKVLKEKNTPGMDKEKTTKVKANKDSIKVTKKRSR